MIYDTPSQPSPGSPYLGEDQSALDLLDTLPDPEVGHHLHLPEDRILSIVATAEALRTIHDEERLAAPMLACQLERHPETRVRLLVDNREQYRTWGLAEELISRSLKAIFDNQPCRAVRLSRLAVVVADRIDCLPYPISLASDLRARAWSNLGNSYRCAGQLRSAGAAFERADEILLEGTGDPLEEASLLCHRASLETDCGHYMVAIDLLDHACGIYRSLGESKHLARALVQLVIPLEFNAPGGGLETARTAERLLDPERDGELFLFARHNQIGALINSGHPEQASMLLEASRKHYRRDGTPWAEINLAWTEARLAAALDNLEEAEASYEVLLQEVLERDRRLEGALVALDLAGCRLALGKLHSAAELAAAMAQTLSDWGAHPKAREAWALLQHSLKVEKASADLIREVAHYLRKSWRNPDAPFTDDLARKLIRSRTSR